MDSPAAPLGRREANWDLLRGLSMFFVVVVHTVSLFPSLAEGFNLGAAIGRLAIICDPVFFMLSGFFALRPLRGSLKRYYLKKVSGIVLPVAVYSVVVYLISSWGSLGLGGYLSYFSQLLHGSWWFIPTLISYLVLAPFLYRALEALDDGQILLLFKVLAFIYIWGVVFHLASFVAVLIDRPGIGNVLSIASSLVPRTPAAGYLMVFLLGYLYRRLSGIFSDSQKSRMRMVGILAIVLCFLFAGFGVGEDDPNQLWVIAAFGLFFVFEGVKVSGDKLKSLVVWIGKRSYTIYLFQYLTIETVSGWIYGPLMFGDSSALTPLTAVLVWTLFTVAAYLLALLVASVLDPLVLSPVQKAFNRVVLNRPTQER